MVSEKDKTRKCIFSLSYIIPHINPLKKGCLAPFFGNHAPEYQGNSQNPFLSCMIGSPAIYVTYSESKYSVEVLSGRYLINCLSYTH